MAELKPCPFCGGTACFVSGRKYAYVYCMRCSACVPRYVKEEKAIEAWNRRVNNGNG